MRNFGVDRKPLHVCKLYLSLELSTLKDCLKLLVIVNFLIELKYQFIVHVKYKQETAVIEDESLSGEYALRGSVRESFL